MKKLISLIIFFCLSTGIVYAQPSIVPVPLRITDDTTTVNSPFEIGFSGGIVSQLASGGALVTITGASGAPTNADYLVGTAQGSLSNEIIVGTTPGGELGNTWASPTIDDGVTVDTWVLGDSTATTINKVTITAPASGSTLTVADGKTLTATNTVNLNTMTDEYICNYEGTGTQLNCDYLTDASGQCSASSVCMGGHGHVAGEYGAASIDGDDVNSNIAGTGLTLTGASPDTLDCDDAVADGSTKGCSTYNANDFDAASGVITIGSAFITGKTIVLPVTGDTSVLADSSDSSNLKEFDLFNVMKREPCVYVEDLAAADDNKSLGSRPEARTIDLLWCHYVGTGTTTADISLEDGSGNAMTHTVPVCTPEGTLPTPVMVTAGNTLTALELLRFDVDNSVDPETDDYTICWREYR